MGRRSHNGSALALCRSLLFDPGNETRKISNAVEGVASDPLIIELGDAVAESRKVSGRHRLADTLDEWGDSQRLLVRLSSLETCPAEANIEVALAPGPHVVVTSKTKSAESLRGHGSRLVGADADADAGGVPLVESAAGLGQEAEIIRTRRRTARSVGERWRCSW